MSVTATLATVATSGNFNLGWVPLDIHADTPNISWSINKSTGGGHIKALVQVTQDDPDVSALAISISTFSADVAETTIAAYTTPIRAIRLAVSASASSNVTFRVLQIGP